MSGHPATRQLPSSAFLGAAHRHWAAAALLLAGAGCALVVLGFKFWLLSTYATNTPYWDQWDAEGAHLFERWLRGELDLRALVDPHNEHRILLTRLLAIVLLELNGLWSPLLEMTVNAALHVGVVAVTIVLLARAAGKRSAVYLMLLATALLSVPYAWENTLSGFQSQFYFVLLFSVAAMWLLVVSPAASRGWWGGVAVAVLAYFSLASGVFALAAAAATMAIRCAVLRRVDAREAGGVALLLALFALGALLTPSPTYHAGLKATSLARFVEATAQVLAWPWGFSWLALARNVPLALFVARLLWLRPASSDPRWFLLVMAAWIGGQAVAIGYGRATDVGSSRYMDLFAIGVLANAAAAAALVLEFTRPAAAGARAVAVMVATPLLGVAWTVFVLAGLAHFYTAGRLPEKVAEKGTASLRQESNLLSYLHTGDRAAMAKLGWYDLPYPVADRLADILASSEVRRILPMHLRAQLVPQSVVRSGEAFTSGGVFPGTVACRCTSHGSFGAQGDAATGELRLRYAGWPASERSHVMALRVAGYPRRAGGIEVIQDGRTIPVGLAREPGERWDVVLVPVKPGPFEVRVVDTSPATWVAVGDPALSGRIEKYAGGLLWRWPYWIFAGLALLAAAWLVGMGRWMLVPPAASR